jgi:hypothetical protein
LISVASTSKAAVLDQWFATPNRFDWIVDRISGDVRCFLWLCPTATVTGRASSQSTSQAIIIFSHVSSSVLSSLQAPGPLHSPTFHVMALAPPLLWQPRGFAQGSHVTSLLLVY